MNILPLDNYLTVYFKTYSTVLPCYQMQFMKFLNLLSEGMLNDLKLPFSNKKSWIQCFLAELKDRCGKTPRKEIQDYVTKNV